MIVIDTDIIIRYLTKDDSGKAKRLENWLELGEKAAVSDVTIAEVFWTLRSFYKLAKTEVIDYLQALIHHKAINCNQQIIGLTFSILKEYNLSFIDSYLAAYSILNEEGKIMSYDKGFDKLKAIKRLEP